MMTPNYHFRLGCLLCLVWAAVGCGPLPTDPPSSEHEVVEPAPTPSPAPEDDAEEPGGTTDEPVPETTTPSPGPAPETPPPSEPAPETTPPSMPEQTPPSTGPVLDADGVAMLFASKPDGSSWSLGTRDPNTVGQAFFDLNGDKATRATDNGITYWTTTGHKVSYASGAPDGRTVRLNIKASGGSQTYTWQNGAISRGYIGNERDLKNLEATVYVRVRGYNGTHTSMSWKLRGGRHSSSNGALASCTGMGVPYGGRAPNAYRELDHPKYDYVSLKPKFSYQLQEGRWVGVKIVSYLVNGGTKNFLYLDTEPFDTSGKPRNNFRLYTEWVDQDGQSTGRYSQAATWGGWVTTFRVDGWRNVDFVLPSAREIVPPAN